MNKHTELSSDILSAMEDIKKIQEKYNLQESETQEIIYQLSLIGIKYMKLGVTK